MDDVTVSKPEKDMSRDTPDLWVPYASPKSHTDDMPMVDPKSELDQRRVSMCEIMAPLGSAL